MAASAPQTPVRSSQPAQDVLDDALRKRASLHDTSKTLVRALESAYPGREEAWMVRVDECLRDLRDRIRDHIDSTEGADGIHLEVITAQPRLANQVRRLVADHEVLRDRIDACCAMAERGIADPDPALVKAVRDDATHVVALLQRHRQRSSDLIYEAYATDIGVGD
jgi:hypothetical protein